MQRNRIDSLVELAASIAGRADEIQDVIVLYTVKGDYIPRVMDNGVDVGLAIFITEAFKHDLLTAMNQNRE